MIGNDIVDLSYARTSRCGEPRFIDKVLNANEQFLLAKSSDPFRSLWQLWAMKEAAYKAYLQSEPNRFFNPKSIECSGLGTDEMVICKSLSIGVRTVSESAYVFAQTNLELNKTVTQIIEASVTTRTQSQVIRKALLKEISKMYDLPEKSLKIVKNKSEVPKIYSGTKELPVQVSLTHHGRYAAYSIVDH